MSYALVRKRAYTVAMRGARYSPYAKRARMVIGASKYLYKNRRSVSRAAGVIGRAWKKRSSRIKGAAQSGSNVHRNFPGTTQSSFVEGQLPRKRLFAEPIKFSIPPNEPGVVNAPNSMNVKVKGFKLCYRIRNFGAFPTHVHMAIVQPKNFKEGLGDITSDFFRSGDNPLDKYIDFDNSLGGDWNVAQDCANINKEKFNIVTHMRFKLNGIGEDVDTQLSRQETGSSWVLREKYFPVNKRFTYETGNSSDVLSPLWLLIWHETVFASNGEELIAYNVNTMTYWNNTK